MCLGQKVLGFWMHCSKDFQIVNQNKTESDNMFTTLSISHGLNKLFGP